MTMVYHFQKRWRLKFRRDPDTGRVLFIGPLVVSFDVVRRPGAYHAPRRPGCTKTTACICEREGLGDQCVYRTKA